MMKKQKTLAFALTIAAALAMTTTSCSGNEDNPVTEDMMKGAKVTVSANIAEGAATRSTLTVDDRPELTFIEGDQIYVYGLIDETTSVAGFLTMDGSPTNGNTKATFTGTVKAYDISSKTPIEIDDYNFGGNDPLALCTDKAAKATLLHKGYNTEAIRIIPGDRAEFYSYYIKADDVETLIETSLPIEGNYASDSKNFTLSNNNPIIDCTLTGLTAGTSYHVGLYYDAKIAWFESFGSDFIADEDGVIHTAFISLESGDKIWNIIVTSPEDMYNIDFGTSSLEAKIYNFTSHWSGKAFE